MTKWNLSNIYIEENKEKLITKLKELVNNFEKSKSELNNNISKERFLKLIKLNEEIINIASKLSAHSALKLSENSTNQKANSEYTKISELLTDIENKLLFFSIWFKELPEKKAKELIDEKYKYHLERIIAFKPHSLKEKEEQIINLKDLAVDSVTRFYDIITDKFTFEYKGKELTQEQINQYKQSAKRDERVNSYKLVFDKYKQNQDILAEIYKTIVSDWKNENIKLRNFKTPIQVRNFGNDVPDKAVKSLLSVIQKNTDLFKKYFKLKSKLLKLKMDRFDLYAPYKSTDKKYPYEESKKITLNAYKDFDEEFFKLANKIFKENHVHSDIIKGKRSGAFCYSITPEITPYILLNHTNTLTDVFTMMHELGHGIHSLLAHKQNIFSFHATLPLAETASIFGEMILSQNLLAKADKEEKISILVKLLDGQYASIVRQGFFVIFEEQAHKAIEEGATVKELNKLYLETLKQQFDFEIDECFQHEWKYIPHIYHTPFYCYAYAFGNLLVLSLYEMYKQEGETFIPKMKKILSYGGSKAPEEILKEINIDINSEEFWQKGFNVIAEEIKELEKTIN